MTHVHFIGIGGSGLSAIARLLLESGYTVTGSDRVFSPFAADVQTAGATVHVGHDAAHIAGADWIVRSSAIPDDNPEVRAALAAGIPVFKRADFLGRLMADKTGIAIAGTHGKTTTTAMLAWTLSELGQEPSFIIGGVANNFGVNARAGKGETFVIEADEYDRMFLGLKPVIEIVTNIEHDHPDCYPTPEDFHGAFRDFMRLLPSNGMLIACGDDPGAAALLADARALGKRTIAYGFNDRSPAGNEQQALAQDVMPNDKGGFDFTWQSVTVSLKVPGKHNVLNALAVLCVVDHLGLPLNEAAKALGSFTGTGRRFELCGESKGIAVFDDYAHHPTEIRTTLAAARARYPERRIWAVWQPHTYSRTQMLFDEFTKAFKDADEVIVTEIYAAREPEQDFSAAQLVNAMPHPAAHFIPALPDVSNYLLDHLKPGDVLLVLSAGDADQVSAQVLAGLQESEVRHV
ncbi:MAG: UDP-N-acetylmuramate--L-alanine ligase [Chloroflexi bacterium]|nr:UDP-N-acetylmuramate--L-alanine ligase [Chloroflexota bacterium]